MLTFSSEKVRVLANLVSRGFEKVRPYLPSFKGALIAVAAGILLASTYQLGNIRGYDSGFEDGAMTIMKQHPVGEIVFSRNAKGRDLNMCAFDKPARLLICATVEEMMQTDGDL